MVALTTQAEYISAAKGFKEALWLKGLIDELGINNSNLTIYCDSQSSIHRSHEKSNFA